MHPVVLHGREVPYARDDPEPPAIFLGDHRSCRRVEWDQSVTFPVDPRRGLQQELSVLRDGFLVNSVDRGLLSDRDNAVVFEILGHDQWLLSEVNKFLLLFLGHCKEFGVERWFRVHLSIQFKEVFSLTTQGPPRCLVLCSFIQCRDPHFVKVAGAIRRRCAESVVQLCVCTYCLLVYRLFLLLFQVHHSSLRYLVNIVPVLRSVNPLEPVLHVVAVLRLDHGRCLFVVI